MNFRVTFCSFLSAVLLFANTIHGSAFPAFGLMGSGIENITKHLYEEVEEGDSGGH